MTRDCNDRPEQTKARRIWPDGLRGKDGALGQSWRKIAVRAVSHVLALGAVALVLFVTLVPAHAETIRIADVTPLPVPADLVVLRAQPAIGPTVWGSEGDKAETIKQTYSWDRFGGDLAELPRDGKGDLKLPAITQEGQAVFRWAVFEMAKVAQQALDAAGISPDDLDVFIPHQANERIIDSMVKTLKLPEHVTVARDVRTTGNTSAASIPLAMERLLATGEAKSGDTALVIGFGAGLVYAATVVTLP